MKPSPNLIVAARGLMSAALGDDCGPPRPLVEGGGDGTTRAGGGGSSSSKNSGNTIGGSAVTMLSPANTERKSLEPPPGDAAGGGGDGSLSDLPPLNAGDGAEAAASGADAAASSNVRVTTSPVVGVAGPSGSITDRDDVPRTWIVVIRLVAGAGAGAAGTSGAVSIQGTR